MDSRIKQSSDVAVFLGPTLELEAAQSVLNAHYLPPIKLGDLYKLLPSKVQTFVIIDGLFDGSTPVWHREILALLEAGRQVIGASSMGALRAVEMQPYGMQGYGQIYQWYRDSVIDGDDEVALLHGAQELGFVKISEPLVNIRYNLQLATKQKIISARTADKLIEAQKALYFGDRTHSKLLEASPLTQHERTALSAFLENSYTDLKRQDALQTLTAVAQDKIKLNGTHNSISAPDWFQRKSRYHTPMFGMELMHGGWLDNAGNVYANSLQIKQLQENWSHYQRELALVVEGYYLRLAYASDNRQISKLTESDRLNWCLENNIEQLDDWLPKRGLDLHDWEFRFLQLKLQRTLLAQDNEKADPIRDSIALWLENGEDPVCLWLNSITTDWRATRLARVGRWALDQGYQPPPEWVQRIASTTATLSPAYTANEDEQWVQVLAAAAWLLEQGPVRFGFQFDPIVEVFKHLQMHGQAFTPC